MQTNYEAALKRVLAHEGGYCNDAGDPGGPTNWGITIYDARMYWKRDADADDVKAMPIDVAKRIYKTKYWDAMRCDELPAGVDYAVFDFGVNSGISRSIKYLESIIGVPQDGKADDVLIKTVASMPAKPIITDLCDKRLAFLKSLKTWSTFGNGWNRRVAEVKGAALKMADGIASGPATPVNTPKTDKPDTAPKPNTARNTTTTAAGAGTVIAATQSHSVEIAIVILVIGIAVMLGVHFFWPKAQS